MVLAAETAAPTLEVATLMGELVVIAAVAMLVKHIRLPYTIALVAAGLVIGLIRAESRIPLETHLSPDLLFTVFLPPLLFEGSLHIRWSELRSNLKPIAWLAVPGLLASTFLVGWALHLLVGLELRTAMVFGALISATDPVSVLAIFKELKAPRRLSMIVEGESLFNDGASVVAFRLLQGLALGHSLSLASGVGHFVWECGAGAAIGLGLGWFFWRVTEQIDDHLIEITLSTILAYGAFLAASSVHASGVVAVIAAGLIYGNHAIEAGMSPNTQMMLYSFWEYAGFLCNSLVFLLIGTQVDLRLITSRAPLVLVAFIVVLLARALVVLTLTPIATRRTLPIPWTWRLVTIWSGLRGSIAIALAMALERSFPERETLLLMTFGVVVLSVFVQGLTIRPLMRRLGVLSGSSALTDYETRLGLLMAQERALSELSQLQGRYHFCQEVLEGQANRLRKDIERLSQEVRSVVRETSIQAEQSEDLARLVLTAQLAGLREAYKNALISDTVYVELKSRLIEGDGDPHSSPDEEGEQSRESAVDVES